jgi:hypothetical protein
LVLAACGTGVSPTGARYDRCDSIKVSGDVVKAVVVQRCTADEWTAEALDCLATSSLALCRDKLTDDQRKKLDGELQTAVDGVVIQEWASLKTRMCSCAVGAKDCAARAKHHIDDPVIEPSEPARREIAELSRGAKKCETRATRDSPMEAMKRFKNEMCACASGDSQCAMRVSEEMTKWAQDNAVKSDDKMSDEDMKAATEIGMQMANCMAAAMGAGGP